MVPRQLLVIYRAARALVMHYVGMMVQMIFLLKAAVSNKHLNGRLHLFRRHRLLTILFGQVMSHHAPLQLFLRLALILL